MNLGESAFRVYCPTHKLLFEAVRAGTVVCVAEPHALSQDFPHGELWEYCCDCQSFWPSEIGKTAKGRERCPNCERRVVGRSLCASCELLSIDSDEYARAQAFKVSAERGVEPSCPGCLTPAAPAARSHECEETGMSFVTARAECPFCEKSIGPAAERAAGQTAATVAIAATCAKCGKEAGAGERFCGRCGAGLGDARAGQPAPAAAETTAHAGGRAVVGTPAGPESGPTAARPPRQAKVARDSLNGGLPSGERAAAIPTTVEATPRPPSARRAKFWIAAAALIMIAYVVGLLIFKSMGGKGPAAGATTTTGGGTQSQRQTGGSSPATAATARMAYVPGGEFTMGSASGDEYERPSHKRTVAPFYIDLYEVTCEEYARFVKAKGHAPPPGWKGGQCPAGAAQQPVTGVNWDDANAYARWAQKRLPTESEWEFAARGTDGRRYPWGDEWKVGLANAGGGPNGGLADVGTFKGTSPFGVFDMSGNAWEWTADDLKEYPKGRLPEGDASGMKVIRGGYWGSSPGKATATFRRGWLAQNEDYSNTGFRCVMNVQK